MRYLVDTHLLLWTVGSPTQLPLAAKRILLGVRHQLLFSAASMWELAIKNSRGRPNFYVDLAALRKTLVSLSFNELAISSDHATAIESLLPLHKDPFDRLLLAQAMVEGCTLLTSDAVLARYPGMIQKV